MSEDIKNANEERNAEEAAQEQKTEIKGTYVHKFKKPFEYEGKK
jgi:hypothetical protein